MNVSSNRHGIPIYLEPTRLPPTVRRSRCVWPGCREWISEWPQIHLCDAHVGVVVDHARSRGPRVAVRPATQQEAKPKSTDGVIYYVRSGGHIKIGWTTDLHKRMRTYPPDSVLLAHHPGTRKDEHQVHTRFAVHRTHGREWYALVPPLLEHIRAVVREHGEPDKVDFAAKPVQVPMPHRLRQGPKPRGYVLGGQSREVRG